MFKQLDIEEWIDLRKGALSDVKASVEDIIERVRSDGDIALRELTERFDKVRLDDITVSHHEIERAYEEVDKTLIDAVQASKERIKRFHEMQRPADLWLREVEDGLSLGVKVTPLQRIGAYVPGGRAKYPSTALMCSIPARVAGVKEVVCCTPPPIDPLTLVAMDIGGADTIYKIGGAQAIAAMALGTETVRPVQKIVGPGSVFVTVAKMLLRDNVEIDFPAGPSEIAVLADSSADPEFIAADILAQAEHDPHAACILVTTDPDLPTKVEHHISTLLVKEKRKEIITKALGNAGHVLASDMDEAYAMIDRVAPEHLSIQVNDPLTALRRIKNAGSIFVGRYAAVACGDYASGTNHVLPTAGYASLYSGLDVMHFCKRSSVQIIDRKGLERIGDVVEALARAEGLEAHASSVGLRRKRST